MKILVLSDSHSALRFMRQCIDRVQPDAVVHLGDYLDDGQTMAEEYPHLSFYIVPGNCDRNRTWILEPETKLESICGVRIFITHGHLHRVKSGHYALVADARASNAQAVLFGHTHEAYCSWEDGLLVLNPGSCGYGGGSAGLLEVKDGQIKSACILQQTDLDGL